MEARRRAPRVPLNRSRAGSGPISANGRRPPPVDGEGAGVGTYSVPNESTSTATHTQKSAGC